MASISTGARSSQPGPIPSAISAALDSNISLQTELKRRLLKIKRAQVQNRRDAARVAASISQSWNHDPEYSLERSSEAAAEKEGGEDDANNDDSDGNAAPVFIKRWACNPDRKGARGFFVDPDGSTPGKDVADSDGINAMGGESQLARVIFERKEPQKRQAEPQKSWEAIKGKNLDLDEVTIRIDRSLPNSDDVGQKVCLTFADSRISKAKFTKQECLSVMSMIGRTGGGSQNDIDWYDLAIKHYEKFKKQTPWLIFSHYRSSLQNPSSRLPPWSPEEDELLLKYLAAHGPQYLLQGDSLATLCKNLFPFGSTMRLTLRANSTLINPNFVYDTWSLEEKRKCALLMRVHCNEKYPINLASRMVHFADRAPKNVAEKWSKTIDPALSWRPFEEDEDKKLQESAGEEKIANRSYNNRKTRWTEIADEDAVATQCKEKLIKKAFAKRGKVSEGDSGLDPKDFMVLPRSKRRKLKPRQSLDTDEVSK